MYTSHLALVKRNHEGVCQDLVEDMLLRLGKRMYEVEELRV